MKTPKKCSQPQRHRLTVGRQPGDLPPELLELVEAAGRLDFSGTHTVQQAAELLQITTDKIYDLIHRGEIPHVAIGRQYRIGKYALWRFMNGLSGDEVVGTMIPRAPQPQRSRDDRASRRGRPGRGSRRRQPVPFSARPDLKADRRM